MNICILSWEYPPRIIGGLGTYVYELSRYLVKMEHNVYVFTLNDGNLKTRELMGGVEVHRPKILDISDILPDVVAEEIRRWGPGIKFFSDIWLYNLLVSTKIVNDLIPNEHKTFDILSVHDWLSAMAGIILKKALKIPMVFHIHSTEKGRTLGDGSNIIDNLEHKAAKYADKIITVSYAMKDELISLGFPSEKIEVVWNGVDANKYSPENVPYEKIKEIREKYGISTNERMILFIGRLTGVKGVDKLILSMPYVLSEFPNVKLVIVGKGEMEGELVNLVERLGLKNNVVFNFKMLPEDERIAHYAACDLAVFPSLYEPFGIVALEAMSMKKPVVVGARGVSGMRESVVSAGPDQTGYHINPYDPQDIAMAIKMILRDENHMRKLGENGRKRVLSEFTWEKISKRIVSIYQEVINKNLPMYGSHQ
ncbi:MAG: glycosyltransferase family 4 protein [Candidatus Verstraetearchaeota archaeon]|nr:glycosyltransferase family 4 protein [Candidatus Verstraetearchaeota archaeon]